MNSRIVRGFGMMDANGNRFVIVMSGENVRRFGELASPLVHFRAIDRDIARRINSDPHAIAFNRDNRHADVAVDNYFFAGAT